MLRHDAPTDAQWLTPEIARFVNERLHTHPRPGDAFIEESRLRYNLLSSQPLCFNVFGQFAAHPTAASRVLGNLLHQPITTIDDIRVEYAPPTAATLLGDRTALDAYVHAHTDDGPLFLAIETKYTEPFSQKPYDRQSYWKTTSDPAGWFTPDTPRAIAQPPTNQLWRNTMLAQLTEQTEPDIGHGIVIVLTARHDHHAEAAITGVQQHLRNPDRLQHLLLEDLVDAAATEEKLRDWALLFKQRYLVQS